MEMNHLNKIAKHLKMMLAQMKIATNGPLKGNAKSKNTPNTWRQCVLLRVRRTNVQLDHSLTMNKKRNSQEKVVVKTQMMML
jgi:hypothetical protein